MYNKAAASHTSTYRYRNRYTVKSRVCTQQSHINGAFPTAIILLCKNIPIFCHHFTLAVCVPNVSFVCFWCAAVTRLYRTLLCMSFFLTGFCSFILFSSKMVPIFFVAGKIQTQHELINMQKKKDSFFRLSFKHDCTHTSNMKLVHIEDIKNSSHSIAVCSNAK